MKTINTITKSVQIYRNGGQILRSGKAELEKGQNKLHILGCSNTADLKTAKLYFPKGIKLSDIRFAYGEEHQESEALQEKIDAINNEIEVINLQISLWKENGSFTGRNSQSVQEIRDYIEDLPERIASLHKKISAKNKEVLELQKLLEKVQAKENTPVMTVSVYAPEAGNYDFQLSYYENGTSWAPVHEIYAERDNPLVIKQRARISQNTYENWDDIEVSLLTGNPSRDTGLPKFRPVYLNIRKDEPKRAMAKNMMMGASMARAGAMADMMMVEDREAPEFEEAEMEEATVETNETMTAYVLPDKKDIPNDSEGSMADLNTFEVPCKYEVIAIPKLDDKAYLTVNVKKDDIPMMVKGQASVYLSDVYTGTANINPDMTGESMTISLGKVEAIQVSREEKKRKAAEAMLLNFQSVEYAYEIKVANGKNVPEKITVIDQVPVSRDNSIKVEQVECEGATPDEKDGKIKWEVELEPKESRTFSLSYKTSWPKDKKISETSVSQEFCPVCGARTYGNKFCPECGTAI